VACGRDAQVKGEMPLRPACMGWNEDLLSQRLTPSESFHPSCQVLLTVRQRGREVLRRAEWAACEKNSDVENLVRRALDGFLADWRAARATPPPHS
jgi:hypothetical protein